LPVFLEFDREPLVGRAMKPSAGSFDDQAREHLKVRDLVDVVRRQIVAERTHT
jgi:hypothetical protein